MKSNTITNINIIKLHHQNAHYADLLVHEVVLHCPDHFLTATVGLQPLQEKQQRSWDSCILLTFTAALQKLTQYRLLTGEEAAYLYTALVAASRARDWESTRIC